VLVEGLSQWRRQDFRLTGGRSVLPSPFPFSLPLPLFPSAPFLSPFLPCLRSKAPQIQLGGLGSAVSASSGVWGRAPDEIEFGAFSPQNMTSGGNNFPENEVTKFNAVLHPTGCFRYILGFRGNNARQFARVRKRRYF